MHENLKRVVAKEEGRNYSSIIYKDYSILQIRIPLDLSAASIAYTQKVKAVNCCIWLQILWIKTGEALFELYVCTKTEYSCIEKTFVTDAQVGAVRMSGGLFYLFYTFLKKYENKKEIMKRNKNSTQTDKKPANPHKHWKSAL